MADARSNEATLEALDTARGIINSAINTIRNWQGNASGVNFSTSVRTSEVAKLTNLNSAAVTTALNIAKAWDGSASST
jgi:hypothetical protein